MLRAWLDGALYSLTRVVIPHAAKRARHRTNHHAAIANARWHGAVGSTSKQSSSLALRTTRIDGSKAQFRRQHTPRCAAMDVNSPGSLFSRLKRTQLHSRRNAFSLTFVSPPPPAAGHRHRSVCRPAEHSARSAPVGELAQASSTSVVAVEPEKLRTRRPAFTLQDAHALVAGKGYALLPAGDPRQVAHWQAQGVKGGTGYLPPSDRRFLLSDGVKQSPSSNNAAHVKGKPRGGALTLREAHALISSKGFQLLPPDDLNQVSLWEGQNVKGSTEYRSPCQRHLLLIDGARLSPTSTNATSGTSRGIRNQLVRILTFESVHAVFTAAGVPVLPLTDRRQRDFWESQSQQCRFRRLLLVSGKASAIYNTVQQRGAGALLKRRPPTLADVHAEIAAAGVTLLPVDDARQAAHWDAQALASVNETTLLLADGTESLTRRDAVLRASAAPSRLDPRVSQTDTQLQARVPRFSIRAIAWREH